MLRVRVSTMTGKITVINNGLVCKTVKYLTREDIVATIGYLLNLADGIGGVDDIDHLGNRRLRRSVNCCRINSALAYRGWSA